MRIKLLIISFFVSSVCFANTYTFYGECILPIGKVPHNIPLDTIPKPTTMDTLKAPLVSILEVLDFLSAINKKLAAMKELKLINDSEYNTLIGEFNKIVAVLEKKKKTFK